VDDTLVVGVLDRRAQRHEQIQPLAWRRFALVAEARDGRAAHQLHDEERLAVGGRSAVEYAGDVGMLHEGQGLPFSLKASENGTGVHARLDYFQGHRALDRLSLLGQKHRAHAALADDFYQLVLAGDDRADDGGGVVVRDGFRCRSSLGVGGQQGLDLSP
jgi:hypothetical protein